MDERKSSLSVLALLCFYLVSWTAAAQETDKRHPAAIAPQGTQLSFQTLDGDTQQINPAADKPGRDLAHPSHLHQRRAARCGRDPLRLQSGSLSKSRQRGGEGGRRTVFEEIYPARRRASLHRRRQGDRPNPRHPAPASPQCPCDHRLALRPDPVQETREAVNVALHRP